MLKEGEKSNKRIARYFYVTVQITSIAHNSMLFFPFQANPFVSVNVVIRSNFVLLCWPFWAFGTSLFFFFLFYHFLRNDHRNRSKITQKIPQEHTYRAAFLWTVFTFLFQVCFFFNYYFRLVRFLFPFLFFYCVDSRALIHRLSRRQNQSNLITRCPSEGL